MAIAIDAVSSSPGNLTWSHTVGSGSNRILLVFVTAKAANPVTAVTYGGVSLTLAKSESGTYRQSALYYLVNPTSGAANVIVTCSYQASCCAISLTGVNQASPITATAGVNGTSATPSLSVTSVVGDLVFNQACYMSSGTSSAFAPGSGQTERYDNRYASDGVASTVSSKEATTTSTTMSETASGVSDNNYAYIVASIAAVDDTREISETITFSEAEFSWNNPERMTEGLTFNDATGGGFDYEALLSEDITFNDAINFLWDMYITEGLTLSEKANVEWDFTVSEGLTLAEVMQCPYWFDVISEALSLIGVSDVENRNVTWREERSINMVGEHIQLLFRNNEVEEGLYLRDIKVYLDRMEDRKAIEAGDYVGEHVRFKFRNNVADEGFYLEYVRIIAIFRGLLGWQV